jgi:hypothetical protein
MILEQVQRALPKDISIKDIVDLSNYSWSTDRLLAEVLQDLREEEFKDNCRIVFYHSAELDQSFDDLPADMLIKLQMLLVEVDIPNFFCLLVSDSIIKDDVEYVCKKYAVDEAPINLICLK